jgi:hypothetical protein
MRVIASVHPTCRSLTKCALYETVFGVEARGEIRSECEGIVDLGMNCV